MHAETQTLFGRDIPIHEVTDEAGAPFAWVGTDGPIRDYENYDFAYEGLKRAVEAALAATPGLLEADICIDVTAGQKVFSVAAGVITLNRGLRFCYAATGKEPGRSGRVFVYDAQLRGFGSLVKASQGG